MLIHRMPENPLLTLHHSNSLEVLRELLVTLIRQKPLTNPLEQELVLVQSPGMARWLQLELAEAFGIAASINFPLPATFLWNTFKEVLTDVPERSAFAKESMTWKLMGLLPEMIEKDGFEPLARYLDNDTDGIRRYQLAGKIADIYDQYLVYRPEWIAAWEAGDNLEELTEGQSWQPELWRALVCKTASLGQSHWHRANMHKTFEDVLYKGQHKGLLPKRLFVFGISALPPGYLEALNALGSQCEVHLMITNPCRYYWGDIRDARTLAKMNTKGFKPGMSAEDIASMNDTGNPLLASMGKLGRDYLHQLQELTLADEPVNEVDAFADINADSLLHHIQRDILELQSPIDGQPTPLNKDDRSLSFQGCHSALREVEVLHDHLLQLFNDEPNLTPRDIIVMVPDIDSYAPFLQAVFGSARGKRFIPFALSDRSASQEHPVLMALNKLLTLDQSRASSPELVELLEVKALQNRFQLEPGHLNTLTHWIEEAGIRWGFNKDHQSNFDIPSRQENTWLFGIRRMLLGYAMPAELGLYDEILPSDLVQGMDAELAGRLADFIESCEWLLENLDDSHKSSRTSEQWTSFLNELLERFFLPDDEDERVLHTIREKLESFRQQLSDACIDEALPRAVLVDWLQENLGNTRNSQRFLAGQVNICTLMPMRSIPFKVVCMLGMNDSAYPRSIPPMGFDLMSRSPRKGDRSRRDDDRYLFLEALLSAQESLYISYVSRNIRDNSERFPSVLVTELQNLIRESFTTDGEDPVKQLYQQQSLQPFSSQNFQQTDDSSHRQQSFAREWLPAAKGQSQIAETAEPAKPFYDDKNPLPAEELPDNKELIELSLTQLIRFWNNPCQAFCQQRLKVYFNDDSDATETREPFVLNGLTNWQLKDERAHQLLDTPDQDGFSERARAAGTLPHGHFGDLVIEEIDDDARLLAGLVRPWLDNPHDDREISLDLNDSRLTGWLTDIYATGQVFWRTGKLRDKNRLSAWIQHLCYCASSDKSGDTLRDTVYLTVDAAFRLRPVEPESALSQLADLERLCREGLTRPLPFFSKTCWSWLEKAADGVAISGEKETREKAEKSAETSFNGNNFSGGGEGTDAYINRCWPELEAAFPEMISLAEQVLLPLYTHLEKIDIKALIKELKGGQP